MTNKDFYCLLLGLFSVLLSFSQKEKDSLGIGIDESPIIANETLIKKDIDPLRPAKAAFLSAVLPGLGQAYNKKYWKIPIVWGAIGTGVYFFVRNDNEFNRYRDAYKRRLAGFNDDEFADLISDDGLISGQQFYRRNKEISLLFTFGMYALNIIEANVDAHLLQFNVSEDLSFRPHFLYNEMENTSDLGFTFNFKF